MPLMSTIIVRTGDTNQRVMERTCNVILEVYHKMCLTRLEEQSVGGVFESSVCSVACVILQLARKQKVGLDFVARYLTMQHRSMRKLRLVWGRLDLVRRSMLEFGFKRSTIFTAGVSNHTTTMYSPWRDSHTFLFYRR